MKPYYADETGILHFGDCLEVMSRLAACSVDIVVTSPPYNLGSSPKSLETPVESRRNTGKRWEWKGYDDFQDCMPEEDYQTWQIAVIEEIARLLKPGGFCFYVHKDRTWNGKAISPRDWLIRSSLDIRQQIVWDRGSTHEHSGFYFYPVNEWVFWLYKSKNEAKSLRTIDEAASYSSIWRVPFKTSKDHPAPFPEGIPARCLATVKPGATVLDPFSGSGTTWKVAAQKKLQYIGIESNETYLKDSIQRVKQSRSQVTMEL